MRGFSQRPSSIAAASSTGIAYSNSARERPRLLPLTVRKPWSPAILTRTVRSAALERYPWRVRAPAARVCHAVPMTRNFLSISSPMPSSRRRPSALRAARADPAHRDGVILHDVALREARAWRLAKGLEWHVLHGAARSADEVVVPVEVRVVAGDGVVEHELLDEAALLQRVQDVVDRGPRRGRHGAIDGGPDLLGRRMPRCREQVLEHGHALLRDPEALFPQATGKQGTLVHYELRLSLDCAPIKSPG